MPKGNIRAGLDTPLGQCKNVLTFFLYSFCLCIIYLVCPGGYGGDFHTHWDHLQGGLDNLEASLKLEEHHAAQLENRVAAMEQDQRTVATDVQRQTETFQHMIQKQKTT